MVFTIENISDAIRLEYVFWNNSILIFNPEHSTAKVKKYVFNVANFLHNVNQKVLEIIDAKYHAAIYVDFHTCKSDNWKRNASEINHKYLKECNAIITN